MVSVVFISYRHLVFIGGTTLVNMSGAGPTGSWYKDSSDIHGLLLDISGVLYDSGDGGGIPIQGSIEAVKRLKASGVPVRFCTNETQLRTQGIADKLNGLGFDLTVDQIFAPAPACRSVLKERGLRPHLLVHPDVLPEFEEVDKSNPNCVVIGDAMDEFSYINMNQAFRVLVGMEKPVLISMGRGKYYAQTDGLTLDVGPFMKALEYACDVQADIVGKPSETFFLSAVKDMGIRPENTLMIGDDIVNDVGGAQACGLKGVQVRTGKYRASEEPHPSVKPDGYVDNLLQAVELYLKHK